MAARKTRKSATRKPMKRKPAARKTKAKVKAKPARKAAARRRPAARTRKPAPKKQLTTVTLGPHTVDRTLGSQGVHPKPAPQLPVEVPALQHAVTIRHH